MDNWWVMVDQLMLTIGYGGKGSTRGTPLKREREREKNRKKLRFHCCGWYENPISTSASAGLVPGTRENQQQKSQTNSQVSDHCPAQPRDAHSKKSTQLSDSTTSLQESMPSACLKSSLHLRMLTITQPGRWTWIPLDIPCMLLWMVPVWAPQR